VPDIQNGGARSVDPNRLRRQLTRTNLIGAIGVEAMVTLQQVNRKPDYYYGVTQAAVEAARSGLSFTIVCTGSESPLLQQKLADENISYRLVDMRKR
jgi:putative transcriptional regulator